MFTSIYVRSFVLQTSFADEIGILYLARNSFAHDQIGYIFYSYMVLLGNDSLFARRITFAFEVSVLFLA